MLTAEKVIKEIYRLPLEEKGEDCLSYYPFWDKNPTGQRTGTIKSRGLAKRTVRKTLLPGRGFGVFRNIYCNSKKMG